MKRTVVLLGMALAITARAGEPTEPGAGARPGPLAIDRVFFAQHHVLEPDSPLFKLVGGLDALIKVQVYSATPRPAPVVRARLELDARMLELALKGPAILPAPPVGDPPLMTHAYEDSFTAVIPGAWLAPKLRVTVELLEEEGARAVARKVFDPLLIGAPNTLRMTMFDVHYFGRARGADYPEGWFGQLVSRLPVAGLELNRVRNIVFEELVMPPRGGKPAARCRSPEEYRDKTGLTYDGEQGVALQWNRALREAAGPGPGGTARLYYLNIYGVSAGGQAGGFQGVGSGERHGVLLHELGHAFGLPDLWRPSERYPYFGPMHGIAPWSGGDDTPHVGPTWGFDPWRKTFLSPLAEDGSFRRDPMGGGGMSREGGTDLFRFFSDFHLSRIRDRIERNQVRWDASAAAHLRWDAQTASFSLPAEASPAGGHGEVDAEVISILGSASLATSEANIVYPPIGPYHAGHVRLFDASSPAGRAAARAAGFKDCNVCLRVAQGSTETTYLVNDGLDASLVATNGASFRVFALNLPARAGEVTKLELLHTPGVLDAGIGPAPKVVYRWSGFAAEAYRNVTETTTSPPGS